MNRFVRMPEILRLRICFFIVITFIWQHPAGGQPSVFSSGEVGFKAKVKDEVVPYKVMAAFLLPNEMLAIEVLDPEKGDDYVLEVAGEHTTQMGAAKWNWQAPQKIGVYSARIIHIPSQDSMTINIFVMVPFETLSGEYLNGYRIGKYPSIPWKLMPIYKPPKGFVEVTRENEETVVAPHFKLKQFLCKQQSDYPKYLVLKERLLLKLELILQKANEKGYQANTFNILSGYRTPYYNKVIGNVKYSRHLWGGAADIFIDENPKDDMMDDLNQDGKIDYRDAGVLYDLVDAMCGKPWYRGLLGGLGRYKKTASHGPFVHVDVRGFRARWGE